MNDRLKGKIINLSFQLFFYCPTIYFIYAESSAMKHAAGAVDKLQPGSYRSRPRPVGTSASRSAPGRDSTKTASMVLCSCRCPGVLSPPLRGEGGVQERREGSGGAGRLAIQPPSSIPQLAWGSPPLGACSSHPRGRLCPQGSHQVSAFLLCSFSNISLKGTQRGTQRNLSVLRDHGSRRDHLPLIPVNFPKPRTFSLVINM